MDMFTISYLFFHFLQFAYGQTNSFVYELYSENEINGNTITSYDTKSAHVCVALCDDMYGCLSVNVHKGTDKCLLTDYYPTDETRSGKLENGWKIYFRRQFDLDVDFLKGASAWQSSTYGNEKASHAIDGLSSTTIHTQSEYGAYWAVQFGTPGPVKKVIIYFRTQCCHYDRNTDFVLSVSDSRDDVINDSGTFCGEYSGPGIDRHPFTLSITCGNTIYGKFLKIKHMTSKPMIFREIEIQTP